MPKKYINTFFRFFPKGIPGLFFSQQASYVILWDVEKTQQTILSHGDENDEEHYEKENIDRIDENVIYWIDLIHEAAPHAQIYCIGVSRCLPTNLNADEDKHHLVKLRFEALSFERVRKYEGYSVPNVIFEMGSDPLICYEGSKYSAIVYLRNRILMSTRNEIFGYDPVAELNNKLVMNTVGEISRKDVLLRWRQLLRAVKNSVKSGDSIIDIALNMLAGNGDIRNFQVSLAPEERKEDVSLIQ